MESVLYHLNIALESDGQEGGNPGKGGYKYSQLVEMWRAANATRENLMIMFWTPESLYNEFMVSCNWGCKSPPALLGNSHVLVFLS